MVSESYVVEQTFLQGYVEHWVDNGVMVGRHGLNAGKLGRLAAGTWGDFL